MYKKTLIRQTIAQYLKDNVPSVNQNVFNGRIDPFNNTVYPYLTVFNKEETIAERDTFSTYREMDLIIGVGVSENQTANSDFDEIIENIMYEIDLCMGKIITGETITPDQFRLFDDVVLESSITKTDNQSKNDIGLAMMKYLISYQYQEPIEPVTLDDWDIDNSLIIITNEGVPQ